MKQLSIEVQCFFGTATIKSPIPLKEFHFEKWTETPAHGIKSIERWPQVSPGTYTYDVEYTAPTLSGTDLIQRISQFQISGL